MRLVSIFLIFVSVLLSNSSFANELDDRRYIQNKVTSLFMQEKFDELNKLANEYLRKESRTSSGVWKLTLFNAGIAQAANTRIRDEKFWDMITEKSLRWVEKHPQSPFAHTSHAVVLVQHGWKYRGTGYAKEVKPENWEPFHDYLKKARKYLFSTKNIASRDPNWYETMLSISTGENWSLKNFNQLVDEAISRFPTYYQIYFTALGYMTPKWHGDKEKIEEFANRAVNRTSSKEGMGMYARIYWFASQAQYGPRLFSDSDVVWKKMKKGIDDVLSQYPDQWNINNFAFFACAARDKNKSQELISKIEGPPITQAWYSMSNYNKCKSWAFVD